MEWICWGGKKVKMGLGKRKPPEKKKKGEDQEGRSQDLEPPGRLVFVVQTVRGIEVDLPGGCRLLLVIQAVGGVEGQASAAVGLVVVMVVVVVT